MRLDEIEWLTLADLSESEFLSVADEIARRTNLTLRHSENCPDNSDALVDSDDFEFFVSRRLTIPAVIGFAVIVDKATHTRGGLEEIPFYLDNKRRASGEHD